MKEKDFQTKFGRWVINRYPKTTAWELKIVQLEKRKSLYMSDVKSHQIRALYNTKHKGIYYKLPDVGIGQKPYDCFFLKAPAFFVVMYYKRGVKHFYMIDIDDFIKFFDNNKSLSEEKASLIGKRYELG